MFTQPLRLWACNEIEREKEKIYLSLKDWKEEEEEEDATGSIAPHIRPLPHSTASEKEDERGSSLLAQHHGTVNRREEREPKF